MCHIILQTYFFQGKITIFLVLIAKKFLFIIKLYRVEFRLNLIYSKLSPGVEKYQLRKTHNQAYLVNYIHI